MILAFWFSRVIFLYLELLLFLSNFYQNNQTRNVRVGSLNSTSAQCNAVLPYVSWCLHCQNFCRMSITRLSLEVVGWGLHNAVKDRRSGKESWASVWFAGLARGQSCSDLVSNMGVLSQRLSIGLYTLFSYPPARLPLSSALKLSRRCFTSRSSTPTSWTTTRWSSWKSGQSSTEFSESKTDSLN